MLSKQIWIEKAKEIGFAGCAYITAHPFSDWEARRQESAVDVSNLTCDPHMLLPEATCVWVLFCAYAPLKMQAHPCYSRYYAASNRGFEACKALALQLQAAGYHALANPRLPHRAAACRAGGILGDNGLYYHPTLGSRISIHLIVTDAFSPEADGMVSVCDHCGACKHACPYGALQEGDMRKCIRHALDEPAIPVKMRPLFSSLLGCEVCQQVCHLNRTNVPRIAPEEEQKALELRRLLVGDIADAKRLFGKNLIRKKRMQTQAALYIGAQQLPGYESLLAELAIDCEAAKWALAVLGKK